MTMILAPALEAIDLYDGKPVAETTLARPAATPESAAPRLTARERDCLTFVAEGKSDWEIGVILGVSQATAHAHVENAKRKLGCRTRAQAVARAYVSGQLVFA